MNFLLTFETAPFFCVYPVYLLAIVGFSIGVFSFVLGKNGGYTCVVKCIGNCLHS